MANNYIWNMNPIQDVLFKSLQADANLSDKKFKKDLHEIFVYILGNYLNNENDIVYLDFDIKKSDEHYKVIGNNILTALWFSGVIPDDSYNVNENNVCYTNDKIYTFNPKTKTLKITDKK